MWAQLKKGHLRTLNINNSCCPDSTASLQVRIMATLINTHNPPPRTDHTKVKVASSTLAKLSRFSFTDSSEENTGDKTVPATKGSTNKVTENTLSEDQESTSTQTRKIQPQMQRPPQCRRATWGQSPQTDRKKPERKLQRRGDVLSWAPEAPQDSSKVFHCSAHLS